MFSWPAVFRHFFTSSTTGARIAALTVSLTSHPNPSWVISKLLLIVIYDWRKSDLTDVKIVYKIRVMGTK